MTWQQPQFSTVDIYHYANLIVTFIRILVQKIIMKSGKFTFKDRQRKALSWQTIQHQNLMINVIIVNGEKAPGIIASASEAVLLKLRDDLYRRAKPLSQPFLSSSIIELMAHTRLPFVIVN